MEILNWIGHKKREGGGITEKMLQTAGEAGWFILQGEPTPLFRPSASS